MTCPAAPPPETAVRHQTDGRQERLQRWRRYARSKRGGTLENELVEQHFEQEKGAVPTDAEMACGMGLSLEAYRQLLDDIRPATFVCLDSARSVEREDGASQYELVADERQDDPGHGAARRELACVIMERLETLPEAQRKVLALYYFEDLPLREIAEVFGVTESRICQIHAQAILAIRNALRKRDPEAL